MNTSAPTVIALITATHHRDLDTATAILDSLTADQARVALSFAVGWLTHEIETACECCVQMTVDDWLQAVALGASVRGAG